MHDNKIIHRDIKCANIFLTSTGDAKLGDLNVSKVAKQGMLSTQTGTPYYASPEVWLDKPYNEKSDIWSVGCVLYEMTTLQPPFTGGNMNQLYEKVTRGLFPRISSSYSSDLKYVIDCLLNVHPNQRPSCDKLLTMPEVVRNINQDSIYTSRMSTSSEHQQSSSLLKTIRLPRNARHNLRSITDVLPKSNYEMKRYSSLPSYEEAF